MVWLQTPSIVYNIALYPTTFSNMNSMHSWYLPFACISKAAFNLYFLHRFPTKKCSFRSSLNSSALLEYLIEDGGNGSIVLSIREHTNVWISHHASSFFGLSFWIWNSPSTNPIFFFVSKTKHMAFAHST